MAIDNDLIDRILTGSGHTVSDETRRRIDASIEQVQQSLDNIRMNTTTANALKLDTVRGTRGTDIKQSKTDSELYTTISDMINGDNNSVGEFGTILDNLYEKNKKYFSIIKDYELMPILIPQINRVLMFLVNECISPDIQNDKTFDVTYTGDKKAVQADIDSIKKEMKLDPLLRNVYWNRYKLGREYYNVVDYNKTFDRMVDMIHQKSLNESTAGMTDIEFIEDTCQRLTGRIDEASVTCDIAQFTESTSYKSDEPVLVQKPIELSFDKLNIIVERSCIVRYMEDAHAELLSEAYSSYSLDNLLQRGTINEAVVLDTSKLETLVQNIRKKQLQRCMIERMDPARVFKLRVGGRDIGCFYTTDINEYDNNVVNFSKALRDQLYKSRVSNPTAAVNSAEKVISRNIAEQIINKFDPHIGINRIEDIDLLHDYVLNNEIYKGNKRVTFYYMDEIYDMSRTDESILTNSVLFAKLYSTLLLNNIITKILRGRGRQIHTVHLGASENVQRYIQNAMASLTMPEANLGTLHGSFEQVLNPFNASSDIIIPTEDDTERFITTDYIPGQDIDMNDDFLKSMLNSIVTSFGLDSAVLDTTNGNLQFARTLSMESLQIANSVRSEQNDLHDSWEAMCLKVFEIMGNDDTKAAVKNGLIKVSFFAPKSLMTLNSIDDINNAKNFAETIADIIPEFNEDGPNVTLKRNMFVEKIVRDRTNVDWGMVDKYLEDCGIDLVGANLDAKIRQIVGEYMDNTEERMYGDENNNGVPDDTEVGSDYGDYGSDDEDLTGEEELPAEEEPAAEEEPPAEEPEETPGEEESTEEAEEAAEGEEEEENKEE